MSRLWHAPQTEKGVTHELEALSGVTRWKYYPACVIYLLLRAGALHGEHVEYIAKSPRLRLSVTLLLTVVIGVLSSIMASQIMPGGALTWSLLPNVSSFWALALCSGVWIFIHVRFLNYDEDIMRYADNQHCIALIRKAKFEGLAASIKKDPEQASLVNAKDFLKSLGVK